MDSSKKKPLDLGSKFKELRKLLDKGNRFLLTGHIRADGDCVGAQTALFHLIHSLGKQATILNPDPLSPRYAFLKKNTQFHSFDAGPEAGKIPQHDALFVLDVNTLERTGAMADGLRKSPSQKIVFDHHVPGQQKEKWDIEIVDPSAAATGLLVYRFAKSEGLPISPAIAEGVFLSVVTDTGWFKYSNTDSETFRVAGELLSYGIDPSIVFQHVYQQRSLVWTKGLQLSLSTVEYAAQGRLATAVLPLGANPTESMEMADSEEILDVLRAVGKVEVVAVFRREGQRKVKISFRSKGDFDVNQFARKYGGGGHRRAAGTEIPGELESVRKQVTEELVQAMVS